MREKQKTTATANLTTPDKGDIYPIMFLHGLESGPHGSKFKTLRESLPIKSYDMQGKNKQERLAIALEHIKHEEEIVLVGSSFGGLVASILALDHPQIIGLLLLAPAWEMHEFPKGLDFPKNTKVIIPLQDEVLDPQGMITFCKEHGLEYITVEDQHRLANSHAMILKTALDVYTTAYGLDAL